MPHETMDQAIERIAGEELEITTLESRHNDDEDFHTLAVWEIQTVMERAYQTGFDAAKESRFVRAWFSVGEALEDGTTQTIDTFDTLQEALRFVQQLGRRCFIDRWLSDSHIPGEGTEELDDTFIAIYYPF